jgi:hypothetical protein
MANPFVVDWNPENISQGMGSLIRGIEQGREKKRVAALKTEAGEVFKSNDPLKMAQWAAQNPEYGKHIMGLRQGIDKQIGDVELEGMRNIAIGKDILQELYQGREKTARFGGNTDEYEQMINAIESSPNPEQVMKQIQEHSVMEWASVDPKGYEAFQKTQGGNDADIGSVSPKDATFASLKEYEATGDRGVLKRYLPQVKMINDIPYQVNPLNNQWEPIVNLGSEQVRKDADEMADIKAREQTKLDFTTAQSKFKNSESAYINKIGSSKSKLKAMKNTANRAKKLISNWSTKYGAALSGLPATDAKSLGNLYKTILANSTFSTLIDLKDSGGTLGAIATAELELLMAAAGTLDQYSGAEDQVTAIDEIVKLSEGSLKRIQGAYRADRKKFGTSFEEYKGVSLNEPKIPDFGADAPPQVNTQQAAPQAAIDALRANPQLKDKFVEKYGFLPEGF